MQPSFDRIRTNGCGRDARAPRGAPTNPVSGYGTCLGQVPESGRVFRLLDVVGGNRYQSPPASAGAGSHPNPLPEGEGYLATLVSPEGEGVSRLVDEPGSQIIERP